MWRKFQQSDLQPGLVVRIAKDPDDGVFRDTLVVKVYRTKAGYGRDSVGRVEIVEATTKVVRDGIWVRLWRPYGYIWSSHLGSPVTHGEDYAVSLSSLLDGFETYVSSKGVPETRTLGYDRWQDRIIMHRSTNEGKATMLCDRRVLARDVIAILDRENDEYRSASAKVIAAYPALTEEDVHAVRCWREMIRDLVAGQA